MSLRILAALLLTLAAAGVSAQALFKPGDVQRAPQATQQTPPQAKPQTKKPTREGPCTGLDKETCAEYVKVCRNPDGTLVRNCVADCRENGIGHCRAHIKDLRAESERYHRVCAPAGEFHPQMCVQAQCSQYPSTIRSQAGPPSPNPQFQACRKSCDEQYKAHCSTSR